MLSKTLAAIRAGTHSEEAFFVSLEDKYGATRDEIVAVVQELGLIKGRISAYFEVHAYLKKKGLTASELNYATRGVLEKKDENERADKERAEADYRK